MSSRAGGALKLGRDVFLAFANIVWADGVVHPAEADALLGAARAAELSPDDLALVERALADRSKVPELSALALDAEEREYVYAIATWLTRVDGNVASEEVVALAKMADLLRLSPEERTRAETASFAITGYDAIAGADVHDVRRLAQAIERAASAPR